MDRWCRRIRLLQEQSRLIRVIDPSDNHIVLNDFIEKTPAMCLFGSCWGGGTFSYTGSPSKQTNHYVPGREARAYDYGLHAWVNPITVGWQWFLKQSRGSWRFCRGPLLL